MRLLRSIPIVFLLATVLGAQLVSEQDTLRGAARDVLLKVRETVMATVNRLPRYLCTETVDRASFQPEFFAFGSSCGEVMSRREKSSWKLHKLMADRLRLDVAVSTTSEMYSWVGESKFGDADLGELVKGGATSTGAFSGFLSSIFSGNATTFSTDGESSLGGRTLLKFTYRVPVEKSHYKIGSRDHHLPVAYSGFFLVDPVTSDLVQLSVSADDIPAELKICGTVTAITYTKTNLNSAAFMIPASVSWHLVNLDGTELDNETAFSGCHEFTGTSTISFGDLPASPAKAETQTSRIDALPANLPFTLALLTPIETKTAAAGDRFEARLTSGIKDKREGMLVPPGAKVVVRITAIERSFGSSSETINIGVKVESVEVNGIAAPFRALLEPVVQRHQSPLPDRRDELGSFETIAEEQDQGVSHLKFLDTGGDIVVHRGLEIMGRTR